MRERTKKTGFIEATRDKAAFIIKCHQDRDFIRLVATGLGWGRFLESWCGGVIINFPLLATGTTLVVSRLEMENSRPLDETNPRENNEAVPFLQMIAAA